MNTTKLSLSSLLKQTSMYAGIFLLAGLTLLPIPVRAADIDIYNSLSGAGNPNILIVLDNSANFVSSAGSAGTCTLLNTATGVSAVNSLAGTTGGIEQCAFYQVLSGLLPNADDTARVNIGFMVYNANSITDYTGANCGGSTGGCLVYPLQPLTATTMQNMKNWITTWKTNSSGAGSFWIKANGQATAATMQEAWAYYAGGTGLSGRSYAAIQPASGCQKNFVIFIGNAYDSNSTPGDSTGPAAALTTAYGATPVPSLILGTKNTTCGSYTFAPGASAHQLGGEYADEWSRFMHDSADIFSASSGLQNIITYSIGVHGASCKPSYAAQLDSMAAYGGGKYFATSDDNSVVQALLRILNEVQAVNSVFSSATLPVSVNTQGTYLNQIYMGMFRPDSGGNPRWIGNVKQYQFSFDVNENLFLSDAAQQPAISSAGTGFIAPGAASFWSCANSTHAATRPSPYDTLPTCALDPAPGFWANNPNYEANTVGGAFDFQDGEVVEKGGAGQQLRLANLTNDYATTPAAPRKLYTDCPQGGCINPDGSQIITPDGYALSDHPFATSNANITAAMFGTGLNLAISGISRTGNTATATTAGSHNLAVGDTVTVVGATPNDYNGPVTITALPTSNSFSYFVQEYPPLTATTVTSGGIGGYVANEPGGTATYALSSLSRVAAGTAANATVTAVTAVATPFTDGASVNIAGADPTNYNMTQNIALVNSTTFTYPVAVNPPPTAVGSYRVSLANASVLTVAGLGCSASTKVVTLSTSTAHGLHTGDQVTVSGDLQTPKAANGTFAPISVLSSTSFSYQAASCPGTAPSGAVVQGGPVSPLAVTLTRNEIAVGTATVTATLTLANQFANGDLVNITAAPSTTTPANETGYLISSKAIACATNPCGTVFSFTISTTPATQPGGSSMTAAGAAPSQTITSLSRSGTTATVTLDAAGAGFADGVTVVIQTAPGTTLASNEGAYTGSWPITCTDGLDPCKTFTYTPVALSPASPATGTMYASNPGMTPDRTSLINWIRGEDNFGDEQSLCPPGTTAGTAPCPSTKVSVRPSVHGDTLHSRPIALNYGPGKGVVVFYGTNDGVYHAINGNQTAAIGSTPAGGELWGFIAKDFYGKFNRQRTNLPALALPSTPPGILPTPQPKDYFIDGPTGVYQTIDGNGETTKAIIYIGARRGGRFIHAVNVKDPADPKYLWKISGSTPGFEELGQTWSQPKVARIRGYANPVLIFGAGYDDGAEDSEPPLSATLNGSGVDMGSDNIGRGIFIVDAINGKLVWHARHMSYYEWSWYWYRYWTKGAYCTGTPPAAVICDVEGMNYSIPADVTLLDKDHDGYIDRLYGVDTGGNVWRLDFESSTGNTPDNWQVTQLAALGCSWGPCDMQLHGAPSYAIPATTATTQRKFFFPAEVISALSTNNYDAVFVGSGDREHPLYSNAAYNVANRMYMIKDFHTGKISTQYYPITETGSYIGGTSMRLADCTGTTAAPNTCTAASTGAAAAERYDKLNATQQRSGYYITLRTGEKVVNAPLTTAGYVYFGTNQPVIPDPLSCVNNLGIARGYQLRPFTAEYASSIFDGGGLPPSSVSGIVDITNPDGSVTQAPFCVGCATPLSGDGDNECDKSSLAGCDPEIDVSKNRKRNYWYLNNK